MQHLPSAVRSQLPLALIATLTLGCSPSPVAGDSGPAAGPTTHQEAPATAPPPAQGVPTGTFCELIGPEDAVERASCFTVSTTGDGVQLEGTAYRHPDQQGVLATWQLVEVDRWDPASSTLTYAYEATFPSTGRTTPGASQVTFPSTKDGVGTGWYTTEGGPRQPFSLLSLEALDACAGRASGDGSRHEAVGATPVSSLSACLKAAEAR